MARIAPHREEPLTAALHWSLEDMELLGGSAGDGMAFQRTALIHRGQLIRRGARRRLDELARAITTKSDLTQKRTAALRPGARLLREWAGESHEIFVTNEGFVWRGKTWKSLSVIAREITGARWSGPRFFGLRIAAKRDGDIDA